MTHSEKLIAYLIAMTELEPHLPDADRNSLRQFYRSRGQATRDSDWPGWEKYLGPRPVRQRLRILPMRRTA